MLPGSYQCHEEQPDGLGKHASYLDEGVSVVQREQVVEHQKAGEGQKVDAPEGYQVSEELLVFGKISLLDADLGLHNEERVQDQLEGGEDHSDPVVVPVVHIWVVARYLGEGDDHHLEDPYYVAGGQEDLEIEDPVYLDGPAAGQQDQQAAQDVLCNVVRAMPYKPNDVTPVPCSLY